MMKCVLRVSILLALVLLARTDGAEVSQCSHRSALADPAELRDTLRQSVCRVNLTEIAAFHAHVQLKHGKTGDLPYFALAPLFNYFTNKIWCRTQCPDVSAQNITWCVNIAYLEEDIETCITPGNTVQPVTNSSCGAQVVGLDSFLSLPSNCAYHGDVGCLGLTNLDWFFKDAYLTCTVHTDSCYEKTFTQFRALFGGSHPPTEINDFPTSLSVLPGARMVLRAEVTSTTSTIYTTWRHGSKTYNHFIEEDPFCNHLVEQCREDNHPNATQLKQHRVQPYSFTRIIPLTGCLNNTIYRLKSYLIINNTTFDDAGEYTFNVTNRNRNSPPMSTWRSVNISVECHLPSAPASCSNSSFSLVRGDSVTWRCELTAPPSTSLHLRLNHTAMLLPGQPRPSCGNQPQVTFHIQETPWHVCYSNFTVVVVICSANKSVVGDYGVVRNSGVVANGTLVVVKLAPQPTVEGQAVHCSAERCGYEKNKTQVTREELERYGNCVPYDTSTIPSRTPCDDLFEQGVDYVYIPYTRRDGVLRSYLGFLRDVNIVFQLAPDRCKREAQLILCHYFLPPCGNSIVFKPPTSVCKDVCNYFRSLCPVEYEFVLDYFQQQPSLLLAGLTFINCSNTGEYIEPLPHCCSDVGINIPCTVLDESGELVSDPGCMSSAILPTPTPTIDSKDPDSSSDGLVAGVATAVGALVMMIMWL